MKLLFGADPELFLQNKRGEFVSAETKDGPLIPGTKAQPYKVKGGAIQVDGVACEFNIDPANTFEEFFGNIYSVLGDLNKRIKKVDPGLKLVPQPTAWFSERYFSELTEKTRELGCEPDFSAYTMEPNPRPQTDKPFRTGSGHIHIGWTNDQNPHSQGHMLDCQMVVRELDRYLYPLSLTWDADKERQELYGKPGSFRPKPFGVEYRPLSNAWLKSKLTIFNVYSVTQAVVQSLGTGNHNFNEPIRTKDVTIEYLYGTQIGRFML